MPKFVFDFETRRDNTERSESPDVVKRPSSLFLFFIHFGVGEGETHHPFLPPSSTLSGMRRNGSTLKKTLTQHNSLP